jgi:2-amino-4-hydroxy-6-hydroxymethyldihydropteridine diphosphokinase
MDLMHRRRRWTGADPIVLALGSNQGDRRRHLEMARLRLERSGIRIVGTSRIYETRPLEGSAGPAYLNACLGVQTRLGPHELLRRCQGIEREGGRVRRARWDARPIDIDLIFHGQHRIESDALTLPHRRWRERDFILRGLLDLNVEIDERTPVRRALEFQHWLGVSERCILSAHSWPSSRSAESSPAR